MIFLNNKDFELQIKTDNLNQIANSESLINDAESVAISEISSYLMNKYELSSVFVPVDGESGDSRNKQMVMYTVDIALYHLHARISPRNVPEVRIVRYENAINWLKMVAKGTIDADLPLKKNEDGSIKTTTVYGSNKPFNYGN